MEIDSFVKNCGGGTVIALILDCFVFPNLSVPVVLCDMHYFLIGIMIYFARKELQEMKEILIGTIIILASPAFHFLNGINYYAILFAILFAIIVLSAGKINLKLNLGMKKIVNCFDSYSYSFYLGHAVMMLIFDNMNFVLTSSMQKIHGAIILITGSIVISILLKRGIDDPICKLQLRRIW